MKGYNKVFLDTAPVIYFLDEDINFAEKVKDIFEEILENEKKMTTSAITCTEYLTFPYKTRAEYKDFKTMDALQLASACIQGCDLFLTNDKQLKQFKEINCITVEEW